ncbi:15628_t:CDS:2, partial [Dentiscutata heterogama]
MIYITKIDSQHNYKLIENINMVASYYYKLSPKMCDEVRLFIASRVRGGTIIEVLQCKNPEKYIYACNIYNIVQVIRCEKSISSDASLLYLELVKQKQENPTYYIDALFENKDNHLIALCWIRPNQLEAIALISDETKNIFTWLFESLKRVT